MAATYDPNLTDDEDKVRLLTGDTDTSNSRFSNEEITAALAATGGSIYLACAYLFDGLAAKYALTASISVDGYSRQAGKFVDNFTKLANRFRAQASVNDAGGLGAPFVGGISEADIDSVQSDADRVPSYFTHDMMNNPSPASDYDE